MTTPNQIELSMLRFYLDEKLINNDINIIDIIMDYALEECDICDTKQINLWEERNVDCYDSDCHVCDENDFNHVSICDGCKENKCYSCGDIFCPYNDDKHTCSDEECDEKNKRIFCDSCSSENLYYCYECEGNYCCRNIYQMGYTTDGNKNWMCSQCIAENMINNKLTACYDK